jgi:hypothetical protein
MKRSHDRGWLPAVCLVGLAACIGPLHAADDHDPASVLRPSSAPGHCVDDGNHCLRASVSKVTCYIPNTATTVANGYTYSDSAGTDGTNGFSGTNWGAHLVAPPGPGAVGTPLTPNQQKDIRRFMNNLVMSNLGGGSSSTAELDHFQVNPRAVVNGYDKWFAVDTGHRYDYLAVWNPQTNCAYLLTQFPAGQGSIANILTKYLGMGSYGSVLGLPTSNWNGDAWGNSWQRFTNGYITNKSTGYNDMTNRAFYVGGTSADDKAVAVRYGQNFDYPGSSSANVYPLSQDPSCISWGGSGYSCARDTKAGRYTKDYSGGFYIKLSGWTTANYVPGELGTAWIEFCNASPYMASPPWLITLNTCPLAYPIADLQTYATKNGHALQLQQFQGGFIKWVPSAAAGGECAAPGSVDYAATAVISSRKPVSVTRSQDVNTCSAPVDYSCRDSQTSNFSIAGPNGSTNSGSYYWGCSNGAGSNGWNDKVTLSWYNTTSRGVVGPTQTRAVSRYLLTGWLGGADSVATVEDAISGLGANGSSTWGMPTGDGHWDTDTGSSVQAFTLRWAYASPTGVVTSYPDRRASVRYNQVRAASSHNTFNYRPGVKKASTQMASSESIRSIEFDIHSTTVSGEWFVYHNTGGNNCLSGSVNGTFSQCLDDVRMFHQAHPLHEVVTIFIDAKEPVFSSTETMTGGRGPADFDRLVKSRLGAGNVYTPAAMLARCPGATTLNAAVAYAAENANLPVSAANYNCGWPTLAELRGKFIIVITDAGRIPYIDPANGPATSRAGFSAMEDFAVNDNVIFKNFGESCCGAIDTTHFTDLQHAYNDGYVGRIYHIDPDHPSDCRNAKTYKGHHLASDHYASCATKTATAYPFECIDAGECSTDGWVEDY